MAFWCNIIHLLTGVYPQMTARAQPFDWTSAASTDCFYSSEPTK